jgi:DNA-binding transcriptional MerR regulator
MPSHQGVGKVAHEAARPPTSVKGSDWMAASKGVIADDDGLLSIGQLAKQTGVSSRTIRYYEELGILPEPKRSPGGTRKYPPEYRFYLEGALALKELDFSLEEIKLLGRLALGRNLSRQEREQALETVRHKMQRLERKIEILHQLRSVLQDPTSDGSTALVGGAPPDGQRRHLHDLAQALEQKAVRDE